MDDATIMYAALLALTMQNVTGQGISGGGYIFWEPLELNIQFVTLTTVSY